MSRRIVSLVPSLSETVVSQGMRDELVGCTQFCVEPADLHRSATVVGGTKVFDLALIRSLKPTHILANQEENPQEAIEALQAEYPLLLTFPKSPHDVPAMLRDMDQFLASRAVYSPLAEQLERLFQTLRPLNDPIRFLYFIWREPYMLAGRDTYISRFLECFGFVNAYEGRVRYPQVTLEEMACLEVDCCLLSSEPYPFRKRDAKRLRDEWSRCPETLKIDGRLMSWYGHSSMEAWQVLQSLVDGGSLSPL